MRGEAPGNEKRSVRGRLPKSLTSVKAGFLVRPPLDNASRRVPPKAKPQNPAAIKTSDSRMGGAFVPVRPRAEIFDWSRWQLRPGQNRKILRLSKRPAVAWTGRSSPSGVVPKSLIGAAVSSAQGEAAKRSGFAPSAASITVYLHFLTVQAANCTERIFFSPLAVGKHCKLPQNLVDFAALASFRNLLKP